MNAYLTFKSLHLIAVISWMAGLLYLPRIFVYHSEANHDKKIFLNYGKTLFLYHELNDTVMGVGILLIHSPGLISLSFMDENKNWAGSCFIAYHFYLLIFLKIFSTIIILKVLNFRYQ